MLRLGFRVSDLGTAQKLARHTSCMQSRPLEKISVAASRSSQRSSIKRPHGHTPYAIGDRASIKGAVVPTPLSATLFSRHLPSSGGSNFCLSFRGGLRSLSLAPLVVPEVLLGNHKRNT